MLNDDTLSDGKLSDGKLSDDALSDDTSNLKSHLKFLHANLAQTSDVDEELKSLLRQLDGDIHQLLNQRAGEAAAADAADGADASDAAYGENAAQEETTTYGLAERSQELTAKFAVEHPRLEPALRELGRLLSNMGI